MYILMWQAHLSKVESIKQMQTVVDQVRQDNVENARRNLSKVIVLVIFLY